MARRMRLVGGLVLGLGYVASAAAPVAACSPPFEPSIEALGPRQLVVLGTTGERVANGRLFHVERWFNGGPPVTPIVIGFKEGEPIGDCSYPVTVGTRLIIAPSRLEDGSLYADLATLQADPESEAGRAYVAEAVALFGPGVAPVPAAADGGAAEPGGVDSTLLVILGIAGLGVIAAVAFLGAGGTDRARRDGSS